MDEPKTIESLHEENKVLRSRIDYFKMQLAENEDTNECLSKELLLSKQKTKTLEMELEKVKIEMLEQERHNVELFDKIQCQNNEIADLYKRIEKSFSCNEMKSVLQELNKKKEKIKFLMNQISLRK